MKFRIYNKDNGLMLGTNQGQLVIRLDGRIRDSFTGHGTYYNEPERNPEYPLMMAIGLQDKDGVDIYQSDIVRFKSSRDAMDEVFTVVYEPSMARFQAVNKKYRLNFGESYYGEFEVIGNIYQNPELVP